MKAKTILIIFALALFLAACAGGPSNDFVKERIYQVFLYNAKVQGKTQCPIPASLSEHGFEEIWKVTVKNVDQDRINEVFFYLQNDEWQMMVGMRVDC